MTKQKMINFITSLDLYPTMNNWNNANGYSYNVKIHSLPLTREEKDKLYEMIGIDGFYDSFNFIIEDWEDEMEKYGTHNGKKEISINISGLSDKEIEKKRKALEASGYTYDRHGTVIMTLWKMVDAPIFSAGFNGRSGGHLVLYHWNGYNNCGTGWNHDKEELEEMGAAEVKEIYNILKDFKKLYKRLIDNCEYLAKHYTVEEENYTVEKTRQVLAEV